MCLREQPDRHYERDGEVVGAARSYDHALNCMQNNCFKACWAYVFACLDEHLTTELSISVHCEQQCACGSNRIVIMSKMGRS